MIDIKITIRLPEDLVKEASGLGILSSEHIAMLIRSDIQAQLSAMARDTQMQNDLRQIEAEFRTTEVDGLDWYSESV
jgi:hypothetical protein